MKTSILFKLGMAYWGTTRADKPAGAATRTFDPNHNNRDSGKPYSDGGFFSRVVHPGALKAAP